MNTRRRRAERRHRRPDSTLLVMRPFVSNTVEDRALCSELCSVVNAWRSASPYSHLSAQ